MTALHLVADIFRRDGGWNRGLPGDTRRITRAQLNLLLRLIGQDHGAGTVESGGPGVTVWKPTAGGKYIITEDPRYERHLLDCVSREVPSGAGWLF